jgi:predicted ATPase
MLDSLHIKNYRAFRELKIDRLGRVNLFIGKNSTGKSCLLEAMQLYTGEADLEIVHRITQSRCEYIDTKGNPSGIKYLFNGYSDTLPIMKAIEIGPAEGSRTLNLKIAPYERREIGDGNSILVPAESEVDADSLYFEMSLGDKKRKLFKVNDEDGFAKALSLSRSRNIKSKCTFALVPSSSMEDDNVSRLWDNISATNDEELIIECLRMIEDGIRRVTFIGDRDDRKRLPVVLFHNSQERIPLKNLGDGTTRLFHIVLALVNAKGGPLLVDEFENGLHWAIHLKIWRSVFQLAKDLNVQVFATTHSLDCVKAFHKAWAENEMEDGACYRLQRDEQGEIIPFELPRNMLGAAIENDVEMR